MRYYTVMYDGLFCINGLEFSAKKGDIIDLQLWHKVPGQELTIDAFKYNYTLVGDTINLEERNSG